MAIVYTLPPPPHLIFALLAAGAVAYAAWRAGALSPSGAWAAVAVGGCIFGFAGGRGAIALLLFFVTSSALSRWGKRRKAGLGYEKGAKRDAFQVLANGGAAAYFALLMGIKVTPFGIGGMLAAIAAANADTWATEIGSLLGGRPRRITNFKATEPGESGAISTVGTLAAFGGALLIGLMALAYGMGLPGVLLITLCGFIGALADSFLGATLQAQYRDPLTGRLTEQRFAADGTPHRLVRGLSSVNNDMVNLTSTLIGGMLACGLLLPD